MTEDLKNQAGESVDENAEAPGAAPLEPETPAKEPVGFEDVKEAMSETGDRLRSAGLSTFIDPVLDGLGDLTRKAFRGLGLLLDEIDDRKRK